MALPVVVGPWLGEAAHPVHGVRHVVAASARAAAIGHRRGHRPGHRRTGHPRAADVDRCCSRAWCRVVGEHVHADAQRRSRVVHRRTTHAARRDPARRTVIKEMNVIGTMQLLAACQRSPQVRKLVVKSSAAVYGAGSRVPAVCTEDMAPKATSGYAKDAVEVE
ncbi:NAD-dependent epimerase/dehydratase family protein, partial [Kibdelosporangium lantanae]